MTDLNGRNMKTGSRSEAAGDPISVRDRRRERLSVCVLYLIMSMPIGGWAARVPELRRQIDADDALWGLANTVPSIGNIIGLGTIVLLAGRVRNNVIAVIGSALVLTTVPLTSASTGFSTMVLGLTSWALVAHLMDVPMGAMALGVQRRYQRPLMGSFDACFALGTLAGGAAGTLAAALGVPPWAQFTVTSALLGLCLALVAGHLPRDDTRTKGTLGVSLRRRFNRRMLPIIATAFLTGYVSESSLLWSAIYVSDSLDAGPVAGGAAYTGAATAGAAALLVVDRVIARIGMIRLVRLSMLVTTVGFGTCLTITHPIAATIGFLGLSIGMACVNPTVYTLAGNQPGLSASEGVSVVEAGQMPGASLLAPALIGALSAVASLQIALFSIPIAMLLIAVLIGHIKHHDHNHTRHASDPRTT